MTRGQPRSALRLAAAVVIFAMVAAGCGGDDEEESSTGGTTGGTTATAAVETIRSGALTVCSDLPYPPFEFEEGGRQVGIDLDLMTAVGQQLGLTTVVQDTDFDGIFAALAAGQCDVIASSVSITDERRQNNEFTQGYYEIQQSLLTRQADAERYKTIESLRGRTVGVQSETTGEEYAQGQASRAGFTIRSFTGADEAISALKAGQVDGVLQDLPVNAYTAEKDDSLAVAARYQTEPEQYGFVVKKGNTALRDAIDGALTRLKNEGRHRQILERYLGPNA